MTYSYLDIDLHYLYKKSLHVTEIMELFRIFPLGQNSWMRNDGLRLDQTTLSCLILLMQADAREQGTRDTGCRKPV